MGFHNLPLQAAPLTTPRGMYERVTIFGRARKARSVAASRLMTDTVCCQGVAMCSGGQGASGLRSLGARPRGR